MIVTNLAFGVPGGKPMKRVVKIFAVLALAVSAHLADVTGARGDIAVSSLDIQPLLFRGAEKVERGKWVFTLGLGAAAAPDYLGSDDYTFVPIPFARATRDQIYIEARGTAIRSNLVPSKWFKAGPVLRINPGRSSNVEDNRVRDLPTIDTGVELGAFARVEGSGWHLGVELAADVASAHGGWTVTGGAGKTWRTGERSALAISAGLTWADRDYTNTFFGVSPRDSARTGLRTFSGTDGIRDANISVTYGFGVTDNISAGLLFSYARLFNDAEDSPITDDVGDPNQIFGGGIVTYTF